MLDTGISDLGREFESIIEMYRLSLRAADDEQSQHMLQLIKALQQNIQIMQRLQSDVDNGKNPGIQPDAISEIADYALNLLDEIAAGCASRGLQEQMLALHRMSIPVVAWLSRHGGHLSKLDIVVNAVASYANSLQDTQQLEALCALVRQIIDITEAPIKQDLDSSNPMRPWRILNLNWGIVATRTHNTQVMEYVFPQLMKNIPADAVQFFNEGMQQMDIVDYPEHVRVVMKKYADQVNNAGVLH